MNGWTSENKCLREQLIINIASDIYCLSETHLDKNSSLDCEGYTCYVNNRKSKHLRAPKPSGGVAILVKDNVFNDFQIRVIDKEYDGILGLKFTNIHTDFTFIILSCYLSPENSVWGRNPTNFFAHLTTLMYMYSDVDLLLLAGDLNGRVGNLKDFVQDVDDIQERTCIDVIKAGHGENLIEFLKDTKMCLTNGRLSPQLDNFTFVSSRGRSVVDYMVVPHECLQFCEFFKVDLMSDLMEKFSLSTLLSDKCKVSDHSMLTLKFHHSYIERQTENIFTDKEDDMQDNNLRFYCFEEKPPNFLTSQTWRSAVTNMINKLQLLKANQRELDSIYSDLCSKLFKEMDSQLKYTDASTKVKKKLKNSKPYWNSNLTELWKNMNKTEKIFLKYKGNCRRNKGLILNNFKLAQRTFDKELRRASRRYNMNVVNEIDELSAKNHKGFWAQLKKLGPQKRTQIPLKVKIGDDIINDNNRVLSKWKDDFSKLLNQTGINSNFDDVFLNDALQDKERLEHELANDNVGNENLNRAVTMEELLLVLSNLKIKKATGPDNIPNEILKCPEMRPLLLNLINCCFMNSIVPSIWKKALIKPIPKGSDKDPLVPLNYRGISLLSTVSKVYSCLINNRIVNFCNSENIFAEEQNGFRKKRSCDDHIFFPFYNYTTQNE